MTLGLRSGTRAVVARGLAAPDRSVRMAAVAIAVDEDLEACAADLYRYVAEPGADPEVVERIRDACARLPDSSSDDWVVGLRAWSRRGPEMGESTAVRAVAEADDVQAPRAAATAGVTASAIAPATAIVDGGVLALLALFFGNWVGAFSGFPKGYDAWGHIAKINLLLAHWPYVDWNDAWYAGIPHFQGSYPPLYHLLVAALVTGTHRSIEDSMNLVTAACVVVTVVATYAFVRTLSGRRIPACAAALLLIGTPAFWVAFVEGGLYPRLLAFAFLTLGAWRAAAYARYGGAWRFALAALATGLALASHLFIGVLALVVTACVVAAAVPRLGGALSRSAAMGASAFGLAGFFYVPYVLLPRPPATLTPDFPSPPWRTLLFAAPPFSGALPVTLLVVGCGVAGALVFSATHARSPYRLWLRPFDAPAPSRIAVWMNTRRPMQEVAIAARATSARRARVAPALRVAAVFVPIAIAFFVYALVGHLCSVRYFVALAPADVMQYVGWFVAVASMLGLAAASTMIGARAWPLGVAALAAGIVAVVVALPAVDHASTSFATPTSSAVLGLLPTSARTPAFRIAGATDAETEALNARVTTPQVRGYQAEARPNQDWQAWLETSLRSHDTSANERQFLVDWYGIKWVYAGTDPKLIAQYTADTAHYRPLAHDAGYSIFEARTAAPIASARSTLTALVIGGPANYELVLRSLAQADVDSEHVIPVHGSVYVDDYSLAALRRFDVVVMYGWRMHSRTAGTRVLTQFVKAGGGLVIDSAGRGGQAAGNEELWPVLSDQRIPFLRKWAVRTLPDPATSGISPSRFASPFYGSKQPWDTLVPRVKVTSKTLLSVDGNPVIVRSRVGAGQVVWSGLNLPYHTAAHSNPEESRFFGQLVATSASRTVSSANVATTENVRYIDPQHLELTVSDSRGVLVKENRASDWSARVDGHKTTIDAAGPDFMWIAVDGSGCHSVTLTYRRGGAERLGEVVSLIALLLLLAGALGGRIPASLSARAVATRLRVRRAFSPS